MIISQVLGNLPFFLILLVAAVLAISRWDKHPTVSLLVVTAVGIEVVARVAGMALPMILQRSNYDIGNTMWIVYGITGLVSNIGLGCLVAACFMDRATKSGPPPQFR